MKKYSSLLAITTMVWCACSTDNTNQNITSETTNEETPLETIVTKFVKDTLTINNTKSNCNLGFLGANVDETQIKLNDVSQLNAFYDAIQQTQQIFTINNKIDTIIAGAKRDTNLYYCRMFCL